MAIQAAATFGDYVEQIRRMRTPIPSPQLAPSSVAQSSYRFFDQLLSKFSGKWINSYPNPEVRPTDGTGKEFTKAGSNAREVLFLSVVGAFAIPTVPRLLSAVVGGDNNAVVTFTTPHATTTMENLMAFYPSVIGAHALMVIIFQVLWTIAKLSEHLSDLSLNNLTYKSVMVSYAPRPPTIQVDGAQFASPLPLCAIIHDFQFADSSSRPGLRYDLFQVVRNKAVGPSVRDLSRQLAVDPRVHLLDPIKLRKSIDALTRRPLSDTTKRQRATMRKRLRVDRAGWRNDALSFVRSIIDKSGTAPFSIGHHEDFTGFYDRLSALKPMDSLTTFLAMDPLFAFMRER